MFNLRERPYVGKFSKSEIYANDLIYIGAFASKYFCRL